MGGITILLVSGALSGWRFVTAKLDDFKLISLPAERAILVYERDQDSLNYYYNRKLSAAFTANFDAVVAKLPFTPLDQLERVEGER